MNKPLLLPTKDRVDRRYRPAFLQSWWLQIVGQNCQSVSVVGRDGFIKGRFLYWDRRNRLGLMFGYNPPLSHLAGFIFAPGLTSLEQRKVIDELIERLPRTVSFHFVFDSHGPNADHIRNSFQAAGFTHKIHRSYLRPPADTDVLSGIKNPEHRRRIKAADKQLLTEAIDADDFLALYVKNLRAAGKKCDWPIEVARGLIAEGVSRKQIYLAAVKRIGVGGVNSAYDGAIACLCDPLERRLYYWLSTRSRATGKYKPHRDAPKVLVKRAMEYAQSKNWIFDADGASTEGAEEFQRNSLGLSVWEERDVFMRLTTSAQAYEGARPRIKRIIDSLKVARQTTKIRSAVQ